jgi:hypothetical protein
MNLRYPQVATLLALTALLHLTACETVHFELTPPTTDAGKACITQCGAIRETCHGNELRRLRINTDACERRADSMYHICLADADSPEKRKMCEISRPPCWAVEEPGRCESDYRACYVQCGGSVDKVVTGR